jgi:hypothetical protein
LFFCEPVVANTFATTSTMISSSAPGFHAARKFANSLPSSVKRRPSASSVAFGVPFADHGAEGSDLAS